MNLGKDTGYLRATLREALLDLHDRPNSPKNLLDVVRDSRIVETLLLLLDRVDALEGKTPEPFVETPKFQDRSFIIDRGNETFCRLEHRQQAEAAGYEVIGTHQIEPGNNWFKLARRPL